LAVEGAHPGLILAIALVAGVLAQSVARHLRVPGIVLLLALGAALGPDGFGWVEPRALGRGLFDVVDLAVAVILFEGGLNLEFWRLRREQAPIRRLVTVGALITLGGATLAVRGLLGWPWLQSALFGSLVVVTGPTVVTPLLRDLRLRPRLASVLEAEGVLIDPIGAILAVLVLEIAIAPGAETVTSGAAGLAVRLGFGVAAGALAGLVLAGLLRVRRLVPEGFENILTLASVLLLYQGCDAVVSTSGILAVMVAGMVVGNLPTRVDRDLREFKDQLTILLIGLLFILLAADVRLRDVRELGWEGVAVVAALVFLIRPLNVWVSTSRSGLSRPERHFITWIAPRGIVAAAIASLTAVAMESRGIEGGTELRALVFLTIAGTVLLAGVTALPVATLLRLRLPGRDTVAILGAEGLGLALGSELAAHGVPILFLDSNPHHCRRAEEAGFPVIFGNALEERMMQRARFEGVGTAIGLTSNELLNSLFVDQAREAFGVPNGYVALSQLDTAVTPEFVRRREARVLFEGAHDVGRWDVRARHGDLVVEHLVFGGAESPPEESESEEPAPPPSQERFVILAVRRKDRVLPMSVSFELKAGDIAAAALYEPERAEALQGLRQMGWKEPASPDVLPSTRTP
jgi:NhaP-type Na+/H+ or K+/H+ antiporter